MAGYNITLYHYTSEEGAEGIEEDQVIMASTDFDRDCVFGSGVYATSLKPSHGRREIAQNNYGNYSQGAQEKVAYAIKITVSAHRVKKAPNTDRDVYIIDEGESCLDLDEVDWSIVKVKK